MDYDYIAKVDSDTILFPPRFLSFAEENLPNHPLKEQVYGGNPIDSLACGKRWWCKRRIMGKTYMAGGLYFLSANLARYIVSPGLKRDGKLAPREDVATGNLVHTSPNPVSNIYIMNRHKLWEHGEHLKDPEEYEKRWKEVQDNWFGEGIPTTASLEPDQAREPEYYQEPEQSEEPDQEVAHDSSSDVSTEIFNDDHLGDIFSTDISTDDDISIDVAQDSEQPDEAPPRASGKGRFKITTDAEVLEKISALLKKVPAKRQEDPFPTNKYPKVRFLWGIFTTEDGFERRKLIRNTYLSVFNATSTPERICGLNDLLKNRLSHPDECQIVYTFVIGGAHDTNVTDLVFNYTEPLRPLTIDGKEDDVIYLNILENMNKGKSQSWLAYAAHLHQQDNNFSFDYVAKVSITKCLVLKIIS